MTTRINIGVLGCAQFAVRSILPALMRNSDRYRILGVASRSSEKAGLIAQQFQTKAFGSYAELLENEALDIVYIPLPNSLHAPWIEKALNNKKHVLVEKSLACNVDDVVRLTALARKNDALLFENFQFRFHRQLQVIKDIVNNGEIGELRAVKSAFGFPPFQDETNIRYRSDLGGGALLDAGAYPIKMAQIWLGSDIEVQSASLCMDSEKGVDIWGGGCLVQRNGPLFAHIAFGFDHYYQCALELWGAKGLLRTNRIFTAHPHVEPFIHLENSQGVRSIAVPSDDHFVNMLDHVYTLIRSGKGFEAEHEQNIRQARLIGAFNDRTKKK